MDMNIDLRRSAKGLILVFILLLSVMGNSSIYCIHAEKTAGEDEIPSYNAQGSIVQVVLLYQDENSIFHIIQSGSGILLDSNTVITNRQLTVLSEENKAAAGAYLTELLGQTITFVPLETEENVQVATYQIAVVIEADIYNFATCSFSSADWDVATLSLSTPMSKECAVLGDSDQVQSGKLVKVLGFPDSYCTDPHSFQLGDLMITEGVCVDRLGGNINHTAIMQRGNTGGALIDEYGRVIGITTYTGTEAEIYSALPINQVKAYLDRDGVAYKEDMTDYAAAAEEIVATDTDTANTHTTVKTDLYRTIQEAKIICEEGNNGVYTEESFRALQVEYDVALNIYEDEFAEQKAIDDEMECLRNAIDGLKKVEKTDKKFVILIVALSVVFAMLLAILVILFIKGHKKKISEKENEQRIKTIERDTEKNRFGKNGLEKYKRDYTESYQGSVSVMKDSTNIGLPSAQLYAQFDAKANGKKGMSSNYEENTGTTVLRAGEGTTVLNALVQGAIGAYLYHSATGESIAITKEKFIIGKTGEGVDYRIDGNTNVSRRHAVITRCYDDYYIEDLGSTNCTYVNGVRIIPGNKQILETNDVIYFADEEFIFMKK